MLFLSRVAVSREIDYLGSSIMMQVDPITSAPFVVKGGGRANSELLRWRSMAQPGQPVYMWAFERLNLFIEVKL